MNVSLTPELESFVQGKVSTGRYTSASEVVLRSPTSSRRARKSPREPARRVDRRLASLDRREGIDGEAVFAQIQEKSDQRRGSERDAPRRRAVGQKGSLSPTVPSSHPAQPPVNFREANWRP